MDKYGKPEHISDIKHGDIHYIYKGSTVISRNLHSTVEFIISDDSYKKEQEKITNDCLEKTLKNSLP